MQGFLSQCGQLWDYENDSQHPPTTNSRAVLKAWEMARIELVRTLFVDVDLSGNLEEAIDRCDEVAWGILEFYFPRCKAVVAGIFDKEEADADRARD